MGSGMLPAGAYVTMEHEFILIFRKGNKRNFNSPEDKLKRQQSAFFWEERNKWFSDVWDFKGIRQDLIHKDINRSAAYPYELPYRLINMYSLKENTILDPFLGTSTTTLAAMGSCRNSIGIEFNRSFREIINGIIQSNKDFINGYINNRLTMHNAFTITHGTNNFKHRNTRYNCPVKTKPETEISFEKLDKITKITPKEPDNEDLYEVTYKEQ
jgi:DNA modification methylase